VGRTCQVPRSIVASNHQQIPTNAATGTRATTIAAKIVTVRQGMPEPPPSTASGRFRSDQNCIGAQPKVSDQERSMFDSEPVEYVGERLERVGIAGDVHTRGAERFGS
jgi:hypothetical protein